MSSRWSEQGRARAWAHWFWLAEAIDPEPNRSPEERARSPFTPRKYAREVLRGEATGVTIISPLLCGVNQVWVVCINGDRSWFARPGTRGE